MTDGFRPLPRGYRRPVFICRKWLGFLWTKAKHSRSFVGKGARGALSLMANHHRNKERSETHEKTAVGRIRRRHGSRGAGDGDGPVLRTLL
jgi:hypothetical protein